MTVNSIIINAISPIILPVVACGLYQGGADKYVTFNVSDDRGTAYCNNAPQADLISVQVHLFVPLDTNYVALKKQIRAALFGAGFTYPVVTEITEDDCNHIIFECEIALERED